MTFKEKIELTTAGIEFLTVVTPLLKAGISQFRLWWQARAPVEPTGAKNTELMDRLREDGRFAVENDAYFKFEGDGVKYETGKNPPSA